MTRCLIQNQQYFLITLETTRTEFGRNPVNLSKKCCHTKETLPRSVPDATFPALHTKPSRGMIGLLLVRWVHVVGAGWPVLIGTGRDQGASCGWTVQMWGAVLRGKARRRGSCSCCMKPFLSLSLSCLYYQFVLQLHQEVTVSNGIIVLIVWWYSEREVTQLN